MNYLIVSTLINIALFLNLIAPPVTKIHDSPGVEVIPPTTLLARLEVPTIAEQKELAIHTTPQPKAAVVPSGSHTDWMKAAGIPESEWLIAQDILSKESGLCPTKWEGEIGYCPAYHGVPTSAGYGLCQATPAHKMATAGADWATNPVTQMKWCNGYAQGYGSWSAAKKFRDCLGSCYSPRTKTTVFKRTTWF